MINYIIFVYKNIVDYYNIDAYIINCYYNSLFVSPYYVLAATAGFAKAPHKQSVLSAPNTTI
jgi:hypothetical protein